MEPEIKENTNNNNLQKYGLFLLEIAKIAIIAFVIVAPIRYFIFQPFIVSGASMSPSLESGDYLIIDEISYRFSEPQRGDVIVFDAGFIPGYANQRFIKRIIGLPGETIEVSNGEVKITKDNNTNILSEAYLPEDSKTYGKANITLKMGEYFVLGDNRPNSYDSRMWGVIKKEEIVGKASLRLLPITDIKIL